MPDNKIYVKELYTSETTGIKLSDLEKIEDSAEHLSKAINISKLTLYDKPFWYMYNGDYYYYKEMSSALRLLNELLGQYFSEYMDLPTVKYDIALKSDGIAGTLSKNFRSQNHTYIDATELPTYYYAYIDFLLRFVDGSNHQFKRKLDALIVKDLFTCVVDRHANTLCTLDKTLDLAPLFDYEYSLSFRDINGFFREYTNYKNPLFLKFPYYDGKARSIDEYTLKKYLKHDKQILRECEKMYEVNMEEVLELIKRIRKIKIPDELTDYYITFYNERKKSIMKVLR